MLTEPTPEMLDALQAFADRNGAAWKDDLCNLWDSGRVDRQPEAARLRSVRNSFGPGWLYDRCKIKPAPKPKPAGYGWPWR